MAAQSTTVTAPSFEPESAPDSSSTTTLLSASKSTFPIPLALSFLQHDPTSLIRLHPNVTTVLPSTLDPNRSDPEYTSSYTVTDVLPLPILSSILPSQYSTFSTAYKVNFRLTPSGITSLAFASGGVVVMSEWTVDHEGRIQEKGTVVEAPWAVRWYVEKTWKSSHQLLMVKVEEELKRRMAEER